MIINVPPTPPASVNPRDYPLTPYQFKRFMRGKAGYYIAVEAVLAHLKVTDKDLWAYYSAEVENRSQYLFATVVDFVGSAVIAPLIPTTVDVSEAAMSVNWMLAKEM